MLLQRQLSEIVSIPISSIKVGKRFRESLGDLTDLKRSLQLLGLLQPIGITESNNLVYGNRRLNAAKELGWIEITARICNYDNLKSELAEHEENLQREDLPWDLEVKSRARVVELYESLGILKKVGDNQWVSPEVTTISKGDIAKDKFHISRKQLHQDLSLAKALDEYPELKKEKSKKDAVLELRKIKKRKDRKASIQQTQIQLPESVKLHNIDFRKLELQNNSIGLIITDPPYSEKYLGLYDDLGKQASKVLRNGGSLLCYAGHYALPRIIQMIEKHGLKFHWLIVVKHSGASASVWGYKVMVGYKPMLWFVKGKYDGEYVRDFIESEFEGKELHEWAQSTKESDYYIKYMTEENEIVYDPFLGQGTFGISAVKLKRQFIGVEIDKQHFEIAQRIISNANKPR